MRKPVRDWPAEKELHKWQQEAYAKFTAHTLDNFLCVAWPGTGKTLFALYAAHWLYKVGDIDQIIGVVPSTALREQWAKSARSVGIDLDYEFEKKSSAVSADYQGAVVTDAAVYKNAKFYRTLCGRKKTLLINDECHHGGLAQDDIKGWGWAMEEAFDPAHFKLSLSGTAFRSDNKEIPFVRYVDGVSVADYSYSYGPALADGVVRELYFPRFEGDMSWLDNDEYYQHNFSDELDKRQESNRLRTALEKGSFIEDMVRKQHPDLMRLRQGGHPNAFGAIKCMGKSPSGRSHIDEVADKVRRITNCEPIIVYSDLPDVHELLKRFDGSGSPWLLFINMFTEGIDKPDCRRGIYASNVISELSVIQFLGRFVRKLDQRSVPNDQKIDDWESSVAFPADRRLIKIIEQIKRERNHTLAEELPKKNRKPSTSGGDPRAGYIGHDAEARPDGFVWDDKTYQQSIVDKYKPLKDRHSVAVKMTDEQWAALVHDIRNVDGNEPINDEQSPSTGAQSETPPDLTALRKLKAAQANRQAYQLDKLLGLEDGATNTRYKKTYGGHDGAPIEYFDKKLAWLEARIGEATNNGK